MHPPVGSNHSPSCSLQSYHNGTVSRFLLNAVTHILRTETHQKNCFSCLQTTLCYSITRETVFLCISMIKWQQRTAFTHLEEEQLLLGAPEERMLEHTGGGGAGLGLSADHLLNQVLCYDVIWFEGELFLGLIPIAMCEHYMWTRKKLWLSERLILGNSSMWEGPAIAG